MSVPSIRDQNFSSKPPATPMKKGRFSQGLPRSPEGKGVQSLLAKARLSLRGEEEELKPTALKGRLFADSPEGSPKKRKFAAEEEILDFLPIESPMKRPRIGSETPPIFTQARHLANSGKMGVFLAKGSYMDVYKINDREVIKVFNEEISSHHQKPKDYLKTILENYQKAVALGIPVAKILNDPLKDGYIRQEYIPEELNPSDSNQFNQIRAFFVCGMTNNIPLDLAPSNLRVENGKVILFDLVEEEDEEMEGAKMFTLDSVAKWAVFYIQELKRNRKELTREEVKKSTLDFINSFTEGFEKYLYNYDGKIDVAAFNEWKEGTVHTSIIESKVIFG